jgi:hypothetical protein
VLILHHRVRREHQVAGSTSDDGCVVTNPDDDVRRRLIQQPVDRAQELGLGDIHRTETGLPTCRTGAFDRL